MQYQGYRPEQPQPGEKLEPGQEHVSRSRRNFVKYGALVFGSAAVGSALTYFATRGNQPPQSAAPQANHKNIAPTPNVQATAAAQQQETQEQLRSNAITEFTNSTDTLTQRMLDSGAAKPNIQHGTGSLTLVVDAPKGGEFAPDKYKVESVFQIDPNNKFIPGTVRYFEAALIAEYEGPDKALTQQYVQSRQLERDLRFGDFTMQDENTRTLIDTADAPPSYAVKEAVTDLENLVNDALRQVVPIESSIQP